MTKLWQFKKYIFRSANKLNDKKISWCIVLLIYNWDGTGTAVNITISYINSHPAAMFVSTLYANCARDFWWGEGKQVKIGKFLIIFVAMVCFLYCGRKYANFFASVVLLQRNKTGVVNKSGCRTNYVFRTNLLLEIFLCETSLIFNREVWITVHHFSVR